MSKLRFAVIGVGHLGRIHARLLGQLAEVELVGIVDPSPEARTAAAAELGIAAYEDHGVLADRIDAAIVATPSRQHYSVASELLRAGVHVFVEKPLTLNVGDADGLIALARSQRRALHVGHVERFNPALVAARPHLAEPKFISAVRSGSFTCRSTDIGVVLDLMIHDLDVVLSLLDDDIASVEALGAAVIGPNEDWAQARLTFARGCVVNLFASRVARQARRTMEIVGPEVMAEIDFAARTAAIIQPRQASYPVPLDVQSLSAAQRTHLKDHLFEDYLPLTELPIIEANGLLEEQRHFAAAIRGEPSSGVSGEQARRALDVAEQILAEIAGHRWEGNAAGTIGPRFETRDAKLRGPHWHQTVSARRKAG